MLLTEEIESQRQQKMVREVDQKDQRDQEIIMVSELEGSQRTTGLTSQSKQDSPA